MKGFEAALGAFRPDEVVVFGAASESFSQRNINCSIAESIERFRPVVAAAHAAGIKVRAAISCALGCPYEGDIGADAVERVAMLMKDIGVDHCGVADTIGVGTPRRVQAAMERVLRHYPLDQVSGHFHDTWGQALANVLACLQMGLHCFDASVAGLGGCPSRPRARPAMSPPKTCSTCSTAWASRPASTSTAWSTPAPSSPACSAARWLRVWPRRWLARRGNTSRVSS